jgi:hypothetical protein
MDVMCFAIHSVFVFFPLECLRAVVQPRLCEAF